MNGSRLTVTWADAQFGGVPGSYVLEVGFAAGQTALSLPLTQRSFTFEPVPNGVYFLRVRARNGAQVSPPSSEAMIVVGAVASPPEAPRNLTHSITGSTLTLTWAAPFFGTPTSYIVEAGFESGATSISIDTGSSATSATFTSVPAGTYYVRVRARNAQGVSIPSNERVVTVN
jgi:hypothetical protein